VIGRKRKREVVCREGRKDECEIGSEDVGRGKERGRKGEVFRYENIKRPIKIWLSQLLNQ
jgi:hypothetical protein